MSVAIAERQATFCATFVDELRARGVRHGVVCPGSRSTPLTLAVAQSLTLHVRLDERSAGFFAQGLARAIGEPVLVVVTSGTAAAELGPAVAEARFDCVPLIVATADRPPALIGVGSPQTIFQNGLFGDHPRFAIDPGLVHEYPEARWRTLASALYDHATGHELGGVPGPVHVNLPFAEPLLGVARSLPPRVAHHEATGDSVAPGVIDAAEVVVMAGAGIENPTEFLAATEQLGWVVLADSRSGLRGSGRVVAAFDPILRADLEGKLRPEVVLLAGAPPASKVFATALEAWHRAGTRVVVANREGEARHPSRLPASVLAAEPTAVLRALVATEKSGSITFAKRWSDAEHAAQDALDAALSGEVLSEPLVARRVAAMASGAALVCSSSMPIRDLEWFGGDAGPGVIANRGANGIDGVMSTAMGVAASGQHTLCLIGDLAFLHDVSALVDATKAPDALVVVVVDNGGGGIFSFLAQHEELSTEVFERLFGTPPSAKVADVARGFGLDVAEVTTPSALNEALDQFSGLPGTHVVVVKVPSREENLEVHRRLNEAVAQAVKPVLA